MNQVLGENERLLEQAIDKDIVQTVVNLSEYASGEIVHECQKCLELETELVKKKDFGVRLYTRALADHSLQAIPRMIGFCNHQAKVLRIPTNPNMKDTNQVKIYLLAYGSLWGNELSERVSGKNSGHRANNILLQHLCSPTDRSGLGFAVSTNVLMSYLNVGCTCTEVIAPIPEAVLHRNMLVSTAFHLPQLQLIKIAPNTKYTSPTTHKKLNSHSFS
ncbi:hypothetical protein Tco_0407284 [Tanacetum coccineum]